MSWNISRLMLRMWGHRFRQLLRRSPYLWLAVAFAPLCYAGGAYLAHDFVYQSLLPFTTNSQLALRLQSIILTAFFSSFGLTAFILMVAALLLTPDDTTLRRVFLPLPISPYQLRIGVLLPGLLLLFLAQLLLWLPTLVVFVQLHLASFPVLLLATLCGLLFYNAATLAFHQGIFYAMTRLFGADRVGVRNTAMGLGIAIGLVILMIPLILGGQAMLTGHQTWMAVVPSYWMMLAIDTHPVDLLIGLGLLLLATVVCVGLYMFFIERCERLAQGTKGGWVPLRVLSFPRSFFLSSCVYELKAISRDQQLVVGLAMVCGAWLAATITVLWLGESNQLLSNALVELTVGFITVILCAIAHMSWGRDRTSYRVLASTPLNMRPFLNGKLSANLLVIFSCWLLLAGAITGIAGNFSLLLSQFPLLVLGSLFCFCLGIALPYSTNDSLSMLVVMGVMTTLGLPLYMGFQLAQNALAQMPGGEPAHLFSGLGLIAIVSMLFYFAIHQLNQFRMEKDRD